MKKYINYILIWSLPIILLLSSGVSVIKGYRIIHSVADSVEQLEGYIYYGQAGVCFVGFLVCAAIGEVITVILLKKS